MLFEISHSYFGIFSNQDFFFSKYAIFFCYHNFQHIHPFYISVTGNLQTHKGPWAGSSLQQKGLGVPANEEHHELATIAGVENSKYVQPHEQ